MTKDAIKVLADQLNKSEEEIIEKLGSQISHINVPADKLQNRIEIIKKLLENKKLSQKVNNERGTEFVFDNMQLLMQDEENVKDLFFFYNKKFGLTLNEMYKMKGTNLFKTTLKNLLELMDHLIITHKLEEKDVIKIIKSNPTLVTLSRETISKNIVYIQKRLNLSEEQIQVIIKGNPRLLGVGSESFDKKLEEIKKGLDFQSLPSNINQEKLLSAIIVKNNRILNTDEAYLKEKLSKLYSIDIDREHAITNPMILTVPTETVRTKYMLGQVFDVPKLNNGFYINNFKTTYARLMALNEREQQTGEKIRYAKVTSSKAQFEKYIGDTMANLYKKYPFDEAAMNVLIEQYNEKVATSKNLPDIKLQDNEIFTTINQNPPAMGKDE